MNYRTLSVIALLSGLLTLAGCGSGVSTAVPKTTPTGKKIELKLKLKTGQTHNMEFITDQKITQTIQNKSQTLDQTIGFGVALAVEAVTPEGITTLKYTYTSFKMKTSGPGISVDYDSKVNPNPTDPQTKPFAAMLGQSITMKVDSLGRVQELTGLDALMDKVVSSLNLSGSAKEQVAQQLRKQFGEEAMKQEMEKALNIYPAGPVDNGDSWTHTASSAAGFPMTIENTYTLLEHGSGKSKVHVVSKISPAAGGKPMEMGPATMRFNFSGTQAGIMEIDEDTGMPGNVDLKQDIKGDMNITVSGQGSQNVPIALTSTITIKTTLK